MARIKNESTWDKEIDGEDRAKLTKDAEAEIAIVGGGLAGMLTAYLLGQEGKKVVLLEKDELNDSSVTSYTTAFITQVLDTSLDELARMFDEKTARLAWESHGEAINSLEKIVRTEKIECEFMRCQAFEYANDEDGYKILKSKHAFANKLGFDPELRERNNLYFPNAGYLEWKRQAKFDPGKFFAGLVEAVKRSGVKIYEKSEVVKITGNGPFKVSTSKADVKCERVVIATYFPFGNPKITSLKKGMYQSYVFEAKLKPTKLREGIYMDQHNPYHYFRVDRMKENDRMIIGGEDHRQELKIDPDKNFSALSEYLKQILPGIEYEIVRKWSGPILEPSDGLALIGEYKPGKYLATAFSGNGMTYSMLSAMIISDLIMDRPNEWTSIYDPKRKMSIKALALKAIDYTKEFIGGAAKNMGHNKRILDSS